MVKSFLRKKRKSSLFLILFIALIVSSCNTDTPTNYITFRCNEISPLGSRTYSVDFYKVKKDSSTYLISNFHKFSYDGEYDITAKITGNIIEITPKVLSSEIRITSGSGTVNDDFTQIHLNYIVFNGTTDLKVEASFFR